MDLKSKSWFDKQTKVCKVKLPIGKKLATDSQIKNDLKICESVAKKIDI